MKVYIVGVAARSFRWDPGSEVWVINHAGLMYEPGSWTRWFHLHGNEHIRWATQYTPYGSHLGSMIALADQGKLVYVPQATPPLQAFPYAYVTATFGRYFNNSFPLLIAFAILEGATEIVLDGVQYGPDKPAEAWAIPCIEYHLGVAAGRGVKVTVPPGSGIMALAANVYGLEGPGSI